MPNVVKPKQKVSGSRSKKPRRITLPEKDPITQEVWFTSEIDRYQKELARKNSVGLREKMKRKKPTATATGRPANPKAKPRKKK